MNLDQNQEIKIPFGLKDNRIIFIKDISKAERGLKCGCKCPYCGKELQARLGTGKRQPHFSHNNINCDRKIALQTALHMLAKELIAEEKQLVFPPFSVDFSETNLYKSLSPIDRRKYSNQIYPPPAPLEKTLVTFDSVTLEKKISSIIPDIIGICRKKECLIEIAVTNPVDDDKKAKVIELNLPMIEIDLRNFYLSELDRENLKQIIIADTDKKRWIHNPKAKKYIQDIENYYNEEIQKIKSTETESKKQEEILRQKEEEKERQKALDLEEKKRRIKTAFQPENYRNHVLRARDDKKFQQVYKKTKMYLKSPVPPLYLDIPIFGEIIFKCDRRVWQTLLFEKFIYNASKNRYGKYSTFYTEVEHFVKKWVSVEYYTNRRIFKVISIYLKILHNLGFVDCNTFVDEESFFYIISPNELTPPNQIFSSWINSKLQSIDSFSMEASKEFTSKFQ